MRIEELHVLIGKRIAGIISVQGRRSVPHHQLFLLLDDNTHFEIFGSALGWSGRIYTGGRDSVMETLLLDGGSVSEISAAKRSGE
jgi:hypothetical protein